MKHKIAKLSSLAVLTSLYSTAALAGLLGASRPLDKITACPKDGNYSAIFAVLLDTTDPLNPVQQEIVQKKLDEFAEEVPRYGKLELFSVRPSSDHLIRPLLQVCNPGRASDTNELTGNPRRDEKRWHEKFQDPLDNSLKIALADSISAKASPLMEEIQQVSAEAFFGTPANTPKRFTIVSDMLQNSPVLNQYRNPESFDVFDRQPGFVKVRPELNDVGVTVLYVRRSGDFSRQGKRHVQFWESFFTASGARIEEIMSVNG